MAQQCRQISHFPDQEYNAVSYVQTHACALPKSCIYFFEGPSQWTMLLSCKNVIQTLSILFITKKFQFHSNHSKSCGDNLHSLTAKPLHNSNSGRRTHGPTTNCTTVSLSNSFRWNKKILHNHPMIQQRLNPVLNIQGGRRKNTSLLGTSGSRRIHCTH